MKLLSTAALALTALLFLIPESASACEGHATGIEPVVAQSDPADGADPVEIAADGTRFDPAITVEQVPAGAWMCDMGTVHYASLEQGDGDCPVCGMRLTERPTDHELHGH